VPDPLRNVVDHALDAYSSLVELAEALDEEWSYVNDLAEAWRERLTEVADRRGAEPVPEATSAAVGRAIAEISLIADPHRAIDWLSTYPQVVLLAFDESP
jgi:hypothetical protein